MKTRTSPRSLSFICLTALLLLALAAGILTTQNSAAAPRSDFPAIEKPIWGDEIAAENESPLTAMPMATPSPNSCPGRSVKVGTQCVLKEDVLLTQTLVVPSNTTLNCMGHKIHPRISPVFKPPQVGIFLNQVRNVRIQQCVIEGFDFGIFAINSKRNITDGFRSFELTCSTIKARSVAVSLMGVDAAEITSNDVSYSRAGGRALYIGRNSDDNRVLYNTFLSNINPADSTDAFRVPGPESGPKGANPALTAANGSRGAVIMITQVEAPEPALLNAVINGTLFQLTVPNTRDSNSAFSAGNRFEANTIRFSTVPVDGVALAIPQFTSVINNRIEPGADAAIRVGMQNDQLRVFPGRCKEPPHLQCLPDTCPGATSIFDNQCIDPATSQPVAVAKVKWISRNTRIEGNEILGPIGAGINTTGQNTSILSNSIVGPLRDPAKGAALRLVALHGLNSSTVMHNSVSNVAVVLGLVKEFQNLPTDTFFSRVSLNDFTGYTVAVLTSKDQTLTQNGLYDNPTDLTFFARGNFWGTGCTGLRPADAQNIGGSPNPHVTDRHPFEFPIAKKTILPPPCF
jgi:hypothetical protein